MMAERRQRIDAGRRRQMAEFLHDLPLAIDPETTVQLWGPTQSLAERFRLTVYDAIYLELAQHKQLALASLDQDLCSAATTVGVPVLGESGGPVSVLGDGGDWRAKWCGAAAVRREVAIGPGG